MADYKVIFKASVDKDLTNLPKNLVARVWQRFELLKQQPFPRQALKLEGSEGLYRLRVGDYRIIYGVDVLSKEVVIHYVRHRREVYRSL
jgi:mRNA interferase RelE/StbE